MRRIKVVAEDELEPVRSPFPHLSGAKPEDDIARFLRALVETPVGAVFERDDGIAPYLEHVLTRLLLRPRRLRSTAREHRVIAG